MSQNTSQTTVTIQAQNFEDIMKTRTSTDGLNTKTEDMYKPFRWDEKLYLDIRKYVEDHVDFCEEIYYDLYAALILCSWFVFKFDSVAYPFFFGPTDSGKTRALEVAKRMVFNPEFKAGLTLPYLVHTSDEMVCTFMLDEIQQYLGSEDRKFMAIMCAGQRRGQTVGMMVKGKEGWERSKLTAFGYKWLSSTQPTITTLGTRCITFYMSRNIRSVNRKIDEDAGAELKKRIDEYARENLPRTLPNVDELIKEDWMGRLVELYEPLLRITPPVYRKRLLKHIEEQNDYIIDQDKISIYAELYKVVEYLWENGKNKKIWIRNIFEVFNDGKTEDDEDYMKSEQIGYQMTILGFNKKCRDRNGVGRVINPSLMRRLKHRYNPETHKPTLNNDEFLPLSEKKLKSGKEVNK